MEDFPDRGVWIRDSDLDPVYFLDPVLKKSWIRIWIQFVLRGWIRSRSISDRIRSISDRI